jgi:hypothetical protein
MIPDDYHFYLEKNTYTIIGHLKLWQYIIKNRPIRVLTIACIFHSRMMQRSPIVAV